MAKGLEDRDRRGWPLLPFGYYVEREPEVLLLRRSDGSLLAAFSAGGVDPLEVEVAVWEDAD